MTVVCIGSIDFSCFVSNSCQPFCPSNDLALSEFSDDQPGSWWPSERTTSVWLDFLLSDLCHSFCPSNDLALMLPEALVWDFCQLLCPSNDLALSEFSEDQPGPWWAKEGAASVWLDVLVSDLCHSFCPSNDLVFMLSEALVSDFCQLLCPSNDLALFEFSDDHPGSCWPWERAASVWLDARAFDTCHSFCPSYDLVLVLSKALMSDFCQPFCPWRYLVISSAPTWRLLT